MRLVATFPRNGMEAVSMLGRAAFWIRNGYYSDDCRRNGGWGKHESQKQAYEIILDAMRKVTA